MYVHSNFSNILEKDCSASCILKENGIFYKCNLAIDVLPEFDNCTLVIFFFLAERDGYWRKFSKGGLLATVWTISGKPV